MTVESFIPHGVRTLIGDARHRARVDETKEKLERQGQTAIDEALITAVNLLKEYGKAAEPTEGDENLSSKSPYFSVEPIPLEDSSLQLKGEYNQTDHNTIGASVDVNVIFPKSPEFPNGRTTKLFSLKGPLESGKALNSHVEVNGVQVTTPKLRIQYGDAMKFIDNSVRSRPQK